jgi:hypothetical protein
LRQRLGISALFPCITSIPSTASVVTIAGEEAKERYQPGLDDLFFSERQPKESA